MTNDRMTPSRRRRAPVLALMVLALAVLAACGDSDDSSETTSTTGAAVTTAPSGSPATSIGGAGTTVLRTQLAGTAEVPGPGDPAAIGAATIILDPAKSEVCWEITVAALSPAADKAHIHRGAAGEAGDVVVTLSTPSGRGAATGCAAADPALITELTDNPQGFYVNLHNTTYPNGAVRGQLAKA